MGLTSPREWGLPNSFSRQPNLNFLTFFSISSSLCRTIKTQRNKTTPKTIITPTTEIIIQTCLVIRTGTTRATHSSCSGASPMSRSLHYSSPSLDSHRIYRALNQTDGLYLTRTTATRKENTGNAPVATMLDMAITRVTKAQKDLPQVARTTTTTEATHPGHRNLEIPTINIPGIPIKKETTIPATRTPTSSASSPSSTDSRIDSSPSLHHSSTPAIDTSFPTCLKTAAPRPGPSHTSRLAPTRLSTSNTKPIIAHNGTRASSPL